MVLKRTAESASAKLIDGSLGITEEQRIEIFVSKIAVGISDEKYDFIIVLELLVWVDGNSIVIKQLVYVAP
jgi:hypothetical protein